MRESDEQYRMIVERLPLALVKIAHSGAITFWNPAAEQISGLPAQQVTGRYWRQDFPDVERAFQKQCLRCIKTGLPFAYEHFSSPFPDSSRFFQVYGYRVMNELVLLFIETTEKVHIERQIRVMNARLRRANQNLLEIDALKSQFIDNVNHELRTPLSAIFAYTELFSAGISGPLLQEQREIVQEIQRETKRLHERIENLLELAQLQSGDAHFNPEICSLPELLEHVAHFMTPLIQEKGLQLIVNYEEDLPEVLVDWSKMYRALVNLIDNAVKFTVRGYIELRAQRQEDMLHVSVIDTGIGISQNNLDIITEQFRQVNGDLNREHGGMGIGLSIAERFITMHNTTLHVMSTPGKGSHFYFCLPLTTL